DTACSSSLVALHLAVQALRSGECSLALAGGVAVMATPEVFVEFSRQRGLAKDGRCRSFSSATDGTGWSEGAGLLVVERLSDARRNGHPVLAIVRGTAVNSDGASNGLMAPNGPAQQRVIRQVLANAGLSTSDVDVVEAHGTGTTLGDPIEAQALLATYGQDRAEPLWLGSVKSNLGHTQAAAGVAGIIKMIQAMRHGLMPRTLHVDEPTPHVDWTSGDVRLLTAARGWPENSRPRRAGISSFGLSGTNAHVIIEQAPDEVLPEPVEAGVVPWVISAKSPAALAAQAKQLLPAVEAQHPVDVGHSLARRTAFEHRAVLVGDHNDLMRALAALAGGSTTGSAVLEGGTAFLFTGQGAQRLGMGRELYAAYAVFAEAFDTVAAELDKHLDQPLRDVLWGRDEELLARTDYAQAGLFAVEIALYRLLEHWGVTPDYLAGHSVGEFAAAHVAGVFSLASAAKLIAARGRLMRALPPGGVMVALRATEQQLGELVDEHVNIAAVNGPDSVVISGAEEAVAAIAARFDGTRLKVSHAFHSVLMEPMLADFQVIADTVTYLRPRIPIVSGDIADGINTAEYWVRHVREAVRFADSIDFLASQGVRRFVELGPDAVLTALVEQPLVVPTMRGGRPEPATLVSAVAQLHASGVAVAWETFFAGARRVDLPTYPFQRRRFWTATASAPDTMELAESGGVVLTGRLAPDEQTWLADHQVLDTILLPGTGFVELALRAGERAGCAELAELTLRAPMPIAPGSRTEYQVTVGGPAAGSRSVKIHSRTGQSWTLHAEGVLAEARAEAAFALRDWPPPGANPVELDSPYEVLLDRGFGYGPMFQGLRAAWRRGDELFAEVALPEHADTSGYVVHPALLDAAMHAAMVTGAGEGTVLPFVWNDVSLYARGGSAIRVRITYPSTDSLAMEIADASGRPVLSVGAVVGRPVSAEQLDAGNEALLEIQWSTIPTPVVTGSSDVTVFECSAPQGDVPSAVREVLDEVLTAIQSTDGKLAIVTRGATTDVRQAPVWGLVRAVQAENPGRFVLVDAEDLALVPAAIATGEDEIAIRGGQLHVPRLARAKLSRPREAFGPQSTVLITGGTGGLGALVAWHLVDQQGVRKLVLVSRSGADAPGAELLRNDLTRLGAEVTIESCDVSDRAAVAGLLARHPVTAVVHTAGVADNGLVEALTPERFDTVLGPKADAAWHLHELTRDMDLTAFVLFSTAGGLVLPGGQGNYAAANAFLDALAAHRQAEGLPATSMAFGLWKVQTGLIPTLEDAEQRMATNGLPAISVEEALALFDEALTASAATVVPLRIDPPVLRRRAEGIPALLRGLVRPAIRPAATGDVLDVVRTHVAAVLGHSSPEAIEPQRAFKELGFDSLAAVELRNQLGAALGIRLPATLVFDYPTSQAVADYITGSTAQPAQLTAPRRDSDDPIAIVGMGCRYPGGVASPDDLWEMVANGVDAISDFPVDRGWDERVYDPEGGPGKTYTRAGGFLYDAADFDAGMFGISPNEALMMDPQQRLLLETSWEAFEHAGIDVTKLKGSATGVFTGLMYHDYALGVATAMAAGGSLVSGRISYTFGLEGPAVTVDTACSSSLVATHLAVQALRSGECSLALAGGVAVMGTPGMFVEFSRQRGLARDGRCKSFSADADGAGWAEGAGVLVLERLSDARRNGHRVLAVIRGSAVNQDGASNGMTAPNGPSQQRVIRQALADAGLSTTDIDAVEAHGTGTPLGDPIEAQAVLATYGQDRDRPLWLGSVKSNMGHAQAAAGVAGVIKMVEAIRRGVLPRTLHAGQPSPHVDWTAGNVRLLTDAQHWQETDQPRRAGVSSFGISGTNAHLIIEQPPGEENAVIEPEGTGPRLSSAIPWLISARTSQALAAQAGQLLSHLHAYPDLNPVNVGFTLATGRAMLPHRAAVVGANRAKLIRALTAVAEGRAEPGVVQGPGPLEGSTAFMFTGQGAQRLRMGQELHATYPVFADAFDAAVAELDKSLDMPLCGVIWGEDEELINQTVFTQSGLFAVEVALYELIRSWGVKPDYLIGHSIGEITAAHVAGVLSLPDAAALVAARGWLMQGLPPGGAMASLEASEDEVAPLMTDRVTIAAINGPDSVVVSGAEGVVLEIANRFAAQGRRTVQLRVSHAFHSSQMDAMLTEFRSVAEGLSYQLPKIPVVSTVTGEFADELETPGHWVRHVRAPVRFAAGVAFLAGKGVSRFVEIGPDSVLTGMTAAIAPAATHIPVQRENRPETNAVVTALAQLHVTGTTIDWPEFFAGSDASQVSLPTYAFQRERYWVDAAATTRDVAGIGQVTDD
ncbi:MAG: type I polyketide synthase, partial [Kibdelosporangium sp.]